MVHSCRLQTLTLVAAAVVGSVFANFARAESAGEIYQRRVLPLIESGSHSSCTECHFRGVELRDFLTSDPAKTFAELRGRGWIDVEHPEKSKLLGFIAREPEQADPLLGKVRAAEMAALEAWIRAAVKEPELLARPLPASRDLELPAEFIRHARSDRVLASFADAVWSQLGRCVNCHSPDRNAKMVKEHGPQMSWIVPGDPAATLKQLTDRELIDLDKPAESQLRTKPLELVEHGGGPKFPLGSETDARWLAFLKDYSRTLRADGYRPRDALPALPEHRSWLSELQIRMTDVPESWDERLLVVTLHRIRPDGSVDAAPVARGDSRVNPKGHVWQNALTVTARDKSRGTADAWSEPLAIDDAIAKGRYLVRVTLAPDSAAKPQSTSAVQLGTFTVEAPWPPGYQPPKILSWKQLEPNPAASANTNSTDR